MPDQENNLVSIIVPCFKQAHYLDDALTSVKEQTHTNWECIIVDDGSPDNTQEIATQFEKLDSRFIYLHKENGGLSSARNAGIKIAKGFFILPLDADDKIGPTYLEDALIAYRNNPELKLVYCYSQNFGSNTEVGDSPYSGYKSLLLYNQIFCSCIYKKSDAESIGMYNENMKFGLEDWDFLLRLLDENTIPYQIPKILFLCRKKEGSMWVELEASEKLAMMQAQLFRNNFQKYLKYWPSILGLLREREINMDALENIKKSLSYRLGNLIVSPLKILRKIKKSNS